MQQPLKAEGLMFFESEQCLLLNFTLSTPVGELSVFTT